MPLGTLQSRARALATTLAASAALFTAGCAESGGARPQTSAELPADSVAVPKFQRSSAPVAEQPESAPLAKEAAEDKSAVDAAEAAAGPLPDVDIANVGMHIGGEKNTNEQKKPIRDAVKDQYDALRRCYAKAQDPGPEVTFGVDMLIPRDGGRAHVTNPRSGFGRHAVTDCMRGVFEAMELPAPVTHKPMMVSLSLRFRKK